MNNQSEVERWAMALMETTERMLNEEYGDDGVYIGEALDLVLSSYMTGLSHCLDAMTQDDKEINDDVTELLNKIKKAIDSHTMRIH